MVKNILKHLTLMLILMSLAACSSAGATANPPPSLSTTPDPTNTNVATMPTATIAHGPKPSQTAEQSTQAAAPSAELQPVSGNYLFAEGPAADSQGNVYFSDINAGKIYRWSMDGQVSVFAEGLKGPNGLAFDQNGLLITCEGGNGRIISIDPQGKVSILKDQYNGVRFNEPNDLWIDPQGGIYFTDPAFNSPVVQGGEDVYYLSPDKSQVMSVITDLVRPNGIVGTKDGKTLYVADYGAGKTFTYSINNDGTLSNKRLFASTGSDGLDLDAQDNLYITTSQSIQVFDAAGNLLRQIPVPENPTNVSFTGKDGQTLFITARTAVFTLQIVVANQGAGSATEPTTNTGNFALTSPDVTDGGTLPVEYTCDGANSTLALSWSSAPEGTRSYAVIMHHEASPTDLHWYWVVYNIPSDVTTLPKNMTGIGTLGTNSVNGRTEYAPPCSKGPGPKTYTYTVYALSAEPQLSLATSQVTRAVLLDAIRDITLASAELTMIYSRQ